MIVAGLWFLHRERYYVDLLYLLGTWLLVSLTPWSSQFPRYLTPVTPILAVALVVVAKKVLDSPHGAGRRLGLLGAAAIVVCLLMDAATMAASFTPTFGDRLRAVRSEQTPWLFYGPEWEDTVDAARWLRDHAPDIAVVATETAHFSYLHSGLTTVLPPMEPDPQRAQQLLDDIPVDFLVLGQTQSPGFARRYMDPMIEAFPEHWRPVFSAERTDTIVYERVVAPP